MNCKTIKDASCECCDNKRLCRTFLNIKPLDEYDDTEPIGYSNRVEWNNDLPIIATIKRNPILGIKIETNVVWSSIPQRKREFIESWVYKEGDKQLRGVVDSVGIVRTF